MWALENAARVNPVEPPAVKEGPDSVPHPPALSGGAHYFKYLNSGARLALGRQASTRVVM